MQNIRKIKKEDLSDYKHYLTVGDLRAFLEFNDLPDSAHVMIQRVEDMYYEQHGWAVYEKKDLYPGDYSQYHPAWCCARYKDDTDLLFIDLHY